MTAFYFQAQGTDETHGAALLKNGRIKMKGLFSEKKASSMTLWWCRADTGDKYVNYKLELPPRQNKNGKE